MISRNVLNLSMRSSAIALAVALSSGSLAKADYPGEVWSVDALVIKSAPEAAGMTKAKLRVALQGANDVYFFGERPLRMVAEAISGATPKVQLTLIEQTTGELLARSPKLPVSADGASIKSQALAWMESLNCMSSGCASAPEVAQPVRVAKARLDVEPVISHHEGTASAGSQENSFGVPIPISRPGSERSLGKRGKARIYPSGLSAKDLNAAVSSLQIAWAIPREVGALTYNDSDRLILEDAVELARATPLAPVAAVPVRPIRVPKPQPEPEASTLFGRLFDRVVAFLTPEQEAGETQTAVVQPAPSKPVPSVTPSANEVAVASPTPSAMASVESILKPPSSTSAWTRASDEVTLTNPIDRFRDDPNLRGVSDGERIAVADLRAELTDPANIRATPLSGQAIDTRELLRPDPRDTDILLATAAPTRSTTTKLSVKLHPELLGRYSGPALAGLTPRRNKRLKKKPSVGVQSPGDASNLNAVLKERGLELNLAGYNRFERVYWGGKGDDGYWISLPNRVNAKFVLVSGPTSSVIAAVRRRGGIPRASKGVAEALGLRSEEWTKLRIISLRPDNQSAALPFLVWSSVLKGRDVVR